jgi:penicillin-binding protein 2
MVHRRRSFRRSSPEMRLYFLAIFMLSALGVVAGKLWLVQIAMGRYWTQKITSRSEVRVRIPSVRGEIRDRNGVTLVGNRASYEVDFYLRDMVNGIEQRTDARGKRIPLPKISNLTTVQQMQKKVDENDIVQIVNTEIIPKLQALDLAKDYNAERLRKHYRNDTEVPFTYLEEIDFNTIAKFSEHNIGLPGVDISVRPVRQYVYGALAAHLLGYVGAPNDITKLPDIDEYNFYQPDVEGKSQIEKAMDKYLRGQPGTRYLERNVKGVIQGETHLDPPTPGANVYLTLDARIQSIVEEALRHPQLGRAAAVVVDPYSGDILGMGSIPSFDPNTFIPSISGKDWDALNNDEAIPLVNRAVRGFPPGSTFKIVTSLAGLTKGLGNSRFNCPGSISISGREFHCWISEKHGQHGTLGLPDALKFSCDCFFYQYGIKTHPETIENMGKLMGIGQTTDLGLSDALEGCVPGPDWMHLHAPHENWTEAQTANVSIGQGAVTATPLEMAVAYAAVGNGGVVYEPRLVKKVLDQNGRDVLDEEGKVAVPDQPKIHTDLRQTLAPQQIDEVRQGLWKVVNEAGGTGSKAKMKNIVVAGKTGTAQASDRGKKGYIAWFCCFAPFDHPRYAIAVMVEDGLHGGGVAAPIANRILEQCLAMDQGSYKVELAKLTPAHSDHPFVPIKELLPYKAGEAVTVNAEEETAGNKEEATEVNLGRKGGAHPDIRDEADARGKLPKAPPQPPPPDHRSLLERFFGRKAPSAPAPAPAPPPNNRPH